MQKQSINDILRLKPSDGHRICVKGWVRTRRDSKGGFSFIELNDGSCLANLQLIADNTLANYQRDILKLQPGSAIKVEGCLKVCHGRRQSLEVHSSSISVYGFADAEHYPLQKKQMSFEKLRELCHLRPRTSTFAVITRIRNTISFASHSFFQKYNFYYLHTPIVTANDCEGAGELFRVSSLDFNHLPRTDTGQVNDSEDFFARRTYLTVSGQLEAEAYASALSKVYTFGPTFRAENSHTTRHLAEFWMIEPEMAFADLDDNIKLAEDYLKFTISELLDKHPQDLDFCNTHLDSTLLHSLDNIINNNLTRIPYNDAINLLQKAKHPFQHPPKWGIDLKTEHERYLSEQIFRAPVVITDFPKTIKPFYMRLNDDGTTVAAMDVLVPKIGEIIGGSQREERLAHLEQRMDELGINKDDYWWYRDLRRFGTVPHAGFGVGLERLIQLVTGMDNIRDVIPFPRVPKQAEF